MNEVTGQGVRNQYEMWGWWEGSSNFNTFDLDFIMFITWLFQWNLFSNRRLWNSVEHVNRWSDEDSQPPCELWSYITEATQHCSVQEHPHPTPHPSWIFYHRRSSSCDSCSHIHTSALIVSQRCRSSSFISESVFRLGLSPCGRTSGRSRLLGSNWHPGGETLWLVPM